MRWSLFAYLLLSLTALCSRALPLGYLGGTLEPRARTRGSTKSRDPLQVPSATYRAIGQKHGYGYDFSNSITAKRTPLPALALHGSGTVLRYPQLKKGTDVDHVYEKQMVHDHLAKNKLAWGDLSDHVRGNVSRALHASQNLAPIPASINRGKGQVVKNGILGKSIARKPGRDEYIYITLGAQKRIANNIWNIYQDHKVDFRKNWSEKEKKENRPIISNEQHLKTVMTDAGILKAGDTGPPMSRAGSSVGSISLIRPQRPKFKPAPKSSAVRQSARIAKQAAQAAAAKTASTGASGAPNSPGKKSPGTDKTLKTTISRAARNSAKTVTKSTKKAKAQVAAQTKPRV